jgi:hypothetical protein
MGVMLAPRGVGLEALIAEAKRRAQRRRLAYALVAVIAAGAATTGLILRGGRPAVPAPPGYHLVRARGPVDHRLIEYTARPQPLSIDLATGRSRPATTTAEVWFDRRDRLVRTVFRIDGRIQNDLVGSCFPPAPLPSSPCPRAVRIGRVTRIQRLPEIAEGRVTFTVPNVVLGRRAGPRRRVESVGYLAFRARRARRALGRSPLWLGKKWGVPDTTVIGTDPGAAGGSRVGFVRYDYATLTLEEFSKPPALFREGPRPGRAILFGEHGEEVVSVDGLLVVISGAPGGYAITQKRAIELAKALRPVPA